MKRAHTDDHPYASPKTDAHQPHIGSPCGISRNGTAVVFVNFTTNDVCKQHGAVDAIIFAATSSLLAHVDMHAVFSSGPANTRLRACVTWLALRCDLSCLEVVHALTELASNVAHACTPAHLWGLRCPAPSQLYVAMQALSDVPLRYGGAGVGVRAHTETDGDAADLSNPLVVCNGVNVFDDPVCDMFELQCGGSGVSASSLVVDGRMTERFERDKYPTSFLPTYAVHRKAARVVTAASDSTAAPALGRHCDSVEQCSRPPVDVLLPALHTAFQDMQRPQDVRHVLALFSALTDPERGVGKAFAYRAWRRGKPDGMEALLHRYLPSGYVKPKIFVMTSSSGLARPTTAVWWWILKTLENSDPSPKRSALLASATLLFELASNVMRTAERVLLWSIFGALLAHRYDDTLKRWLPTEPICAGDKHLFDIPWLHGLSETTAATCHFATAYARLSELARSCNASESAALMATKSVTEQLSARSVVDVSDVMSFERQIV